ncbi:hypothetical protein [Pseudomonas sp. M30-35]|uniref:hypothetical protein n=1 Tax=Pseudomonas sp. M30-35 TaxID=1981174 RepID=UPI000B3CD2A7|nr:hypothetical protein [Pseudomonas sp. M30-35]ARU89122.1 hypothetical protein B9K09_14595 [Pseudomonas sp. M30-35]
MLRTLLLYAGLLSSCLLQAAPIERPEIHFESTAEYTAKVIISRDRDAPTACDVEVLITGQDPLSLPLGESVALSIPAGKFNVELTLSPAGYCGSINLISEQSMLIKPGQTRYFQVVVSQDNIFLAPQPGPGQTSSNE